MFHEIQTRKRAVLFIAGAIALSLVTGCVSSGESADARSSASPNGGPGGGMAMSGGNPPSGMPPSGNPPSGMARNAPGGGKPDGAQGGSGMTFVSLAESKTSKYFTDLDASTSKINAYADWLREKGYLAGYSDKYFPAKALTRADLASMLYAKYKWSGEGFSYGDVSDAEYYYQAAMRGKASGVLPDAKYFNPDAAVTREEAAVWMFKAESLAGMPSEMASDDVSKFRDFSSISSDARKAAATMVRLGILSADTKGNFDPKGTITRAEIALVMYRLAQLGGGPGGQSAPAGMAGGSGGPGGGSQTVDHGTYASKVDSDVSGKLFASSGDKENVVRVEGKITVTLNDITVNKSGGEAGTGDTSNFYGSNAGLLALDGANVTVKNAKVTTSAKGGNGIFSYGSGTTVTVEKATIRTTKDSSGGVMVTGGGTMYVADSDIDTQGGSSAALRTDRGGGKLVVKGGSYVTHGNGSPAIYSTADISASDATLTATGSEAVVVEGKNSVALKNCAVSGNMIKDNVENLQNVMIYQSMSGDAVSGKSSFTMEGGSLVSNNGDMFYVTNTSCQVKLTDVALKLSSDYLLKVVGNDARNGWGVVGKNGGQCAFSAKAQTLSGKIKVDSISTLALSLADSSSFTGSVNAEKEGGKVSVNLDSSSVWTLTADSYISEFSGSLDSVKTNGHALYVGGKIAKN
jgi:hypothetical protein